MTATRTPKPRRALRATRAGLLGAAVGLAATAAVPAPAQVGFTQTPLNGLPVTLVYPTGAPRPPGTRSVPSSSRWRWMRRWPSHPGRAGGWSSPRTARAAARCPTLASRQAFLPAALKAWRGGRSPGPDAAAPFDPRPDARIAAVSLSVPLATIFSAESLARVRVPVGLPAAQADEMLVPRFHSGHLRQHCNSCTVLAELPGATHFDVMQPRPAAVAEVVSRQQVRGVATNPAFDGRQRDEAYARVVQFHRRHLGGD